MRVREGGLVGQFHGNRGREPASKSDERLWQKVLKIDHPTPVWKRPLSRYGTNRWIVFSPKLRRTVILYNSLEYDHWVLVESEPAISSYCEQPRRIRMRLPSGVVTTVFNMWILWDSMLQEYRAVRCLKDLSRANGGSRISRELEAQKLWCQLEGVCHSVLTEETIRANLTYLENWKIILSHLAAAQNIDLRPQLNEIIAMLVSEGGRHLRQIEASFPNTDRLLTRAAIFFLLHSGRLRAPLDRVTLTASMPVEIAP